MNSQGLIIQLRDLAIFVRINEANSNAIQVMQYAKIVNFFIRKVQYPLNVM